MAFEILSPSDSVIEAPQEIRRGQGPRDKVHSVPCNLSPVPCERKRLDYQQSGVIQVWFDLEKRLVELIYPDRPLQYYHRDQALTIDTIPGFSLDLKDLFSP